MYCEDSDIAGLASDTKMSAGIKRYSLDETNAKQLWTSSKKLTDTTFKMG